MTDETTGELLEETPISSEETSDDALKESLKKRLELELGLPLTPKTMKKIDSSFNDKVILIENFPVQSIISLKIGDKSFTEEDYLLDEFEGVIYLDNEYNGLLYLEYTFGLSEDEYMPLLDLMLEYETDTGWNKNATSIHENNVSVNYDTSLGKGAIIQGMINDLRNKYSVYVEMI